MEDKNINRKEALERLGGLALGSGFIPPLIGGRNKQNIKEQAQDKQSQSGKARSGQPNILFLMSDQHRSDFLGAAGADWISTPNLDKLAQEGTRFSNAYCSTPSCTPARTSILTGLSPWNHGLLGYIGTVSQYYWWPMPQFFSVKGYHTTAVGKNHFGPPRNSQGFLKQKLEEGWYSSRKKGFICDYQSWFHRVAPNKDINATGLSYTSHRGGIPFKFNDKLHATHWTAERGIELLKDSNDKLPWFLKISFQRPHPPFDPPKRWLEYYLNSSEIPIPKVGEWAKEKYADKIRTFEEHPSATSGIFPDNEIRLSRATYAGSISFVDEQIGRIISVLKEIGQYENTLILYTSDHGDMMGDQYMWRKCRGYEPSANIPMLIRCPKSIGIAHDKGSVVDELVELRDIFPTFADACNLNIPVEIDGKSMLGLVKKEKGTWRNQLGLEHSQIYEPDNAWIALTDGRYKYIYFTLTGEEQLFDLKNDPYELENIVFDNEELHQEWYNRMVKHLVKRGSKWVQNNKLQVQDKSIRIGKNFPKQRMERLGFSI